MFGEPLDLTLEFIGGEFTTILQHLFQLRQFIGDLDLGGEISKSNITKANPLRRRSALLFAKEKVWKLKRNNEKKRLSTNSPN